MGAGEGVPEDTSREVQSTKQGLGEMLEDPAKTCEARGQ